MLSPASMEELPDEVVQLNDLVAERLPRVELVEVLIEVDSWTGFTQFFRHAGGARSRNPDLVRHASRGDPGPGLQLRPHDDGRHRRFDLPPVSMDHGLVPARGDAGLRTRISVVESTAS